MRRRSTVTGLSDAALLRAAHPLRLLASIVGLAVVAVAALVHGAAAGHTPAPMPPVPQQVVARADTDSVAIALDSLAAADTLTVPDTGRAAIYLPNPGRDRYTASLLTRKVHPFFGRLGSYWRQDVQLDSTGQYIVRESVGNSDVRYPLSLDYETYRQERLDATVRQNWRTLADQRARQQAQRRGSRGLGISVVIPGGRQSAFTTIFGKNEVDLRVTGQADIKAGFNYRKSDQQVALTGRATQVDPDFKQDLRLGITGTIGDKLQINVNYDSNNQFDFQNQLKLQYTGYEDEIIKSIEAGNVFLQTPSSLIRGGQSLFGIKSQFQVGGVQLTTVMSQQEGQANSLNIEGGSETTEFDLKPTDFIDRTHFFLSYYFRNRWEDALSDPPTIRIANGFERIAEVEVWKLQPTSPDDPNVRQAVAMVDLGEPTEVLDLADNFTATILPDSTLDQYTQFDLASELRDGNITPNSFLESRGLTDADFQAGKFKLLERGRDYTIDEVLGYISLRQRLLESEALAVSFTYIANGRAFQVGDFARDTGGTTGAQNDNRLVLKLIRPIQLRQPAPASNFNPAAWYLELRNMYSLQGRSLNPQDFVLQVFFEPPGQPASKTLPGVGGQKTLLQLLGLDQLNEDGAPQPDDLFDFIPNVFINPGDGQLIFPYLEPFGDHIADVIDQSAGTPQGKEELKNLYVFDDLYREKKENARRDTQRDVYRIRGSYKGSVQDFYDLRAYAGLVPGSVQVTSGGTPLQEGADFIVDYQGGNVTIINPSYLTAGRDIDIQYEQNSFFNLQKKTLLGARADYALDDRFAMGATLMRLSQKSPIDKFRIGEEPISNTIWGLDGALSLEPRWMTRVIDALPLIQTRAPSSFSITGEFAQLRPGHTETVAFERTRRDLRNEGRDFNSDELAGISYIDDFEGFENTFSLKQPGTWSLAAAPDSIGAIDQFGVLNSRLADSLRTTWRGRLSWYQLNVNMLRELGAVPIDSDLNAVDIVQIEDVFPNRDTRGQTDRTQTTLDLYFDPFQRGPYNYTTDLPGFFQNPKQTWGGITQRLPEGFTDFSVKNVDFVEFIIRAFPENESGDAGRDATLYIDLGSISEDVLPDERLYNEDGLSLSSISASSILTWGRFPTSTQNNAVDVDDATRRTEDLGLDGLASYDASAYPITEQDHFQNFLNAMQGGSVCDQLAGNIQTRCRAEVARAQVDPSGDDYHYFGNTQFYDDAQFFPGGATLQQRFGHYFSGHELNAFEAQNKLANNTSIKRGNSRFPDSEDFNLNSTVDTDNSYFQYAVPLSLDSLRLYSDPTRVDDYVVGEITDDNGTGTGWYQIRIPVRDYTRRVGNIQDFTLIESMRIWTTGHQVPITVRLATLELVGSQWQKSDQITLERETPADTLNTDTRLSISSVNNEENPNIYLPPNGTVISQTRLTSGIAQNSREQAMVIRAENLYPGQQRAIFRTYNQGHDLLKYTNLRMFMHMHGKTAFGTDLAALAMTDKAAAREKVRVFVRLGSNERNDYYEYEQPLTPSNEVAGSSDELWQTNQDFNGEIQDLNSMNIFLGALNQLKVARDRLGIPTDSVFWNAIGDTLVSPDVPDAERFAPPGTRLAIKGTPSLSRINTIVVGLRNPADSLNAAGMPNFDPDDILEDITLWINELRVAGYDENNGWSALMNADIQLADLARVKANFQTQTDGFGSLSSTLDERDQNDISNWSVTTEFNADKFIPERFGWAVPLSVQVQSNTSTPRFAPARGDVRLSELLAQIEDREDLTPVQKDSLLNVTEQASQTHNFTRSFTSRLSKANSKSRLLRNTVDGLSLNYSYTDSEARTPSLQANNTWRWSTTLNYRLAVRRPRTVRPLWFLEPIPVLGLLGDLRFNYLPQSLNTSGTATRNFSQTRDRPKSITRDTSITRLPELIEFPLREKQSFAHNRTFSLQYNPFGFLNLSFDTNTSQSLNALGADTLFSVVTLDTVFQNIDFDRALRQGLIDSSQVGVTAFESTRLRVIPMGSVANKVLANDEGLRTEQHTQRFTGTFRPQLGNTKALDWINIQDFSYGVQYAWQNGALGRNTGANVRNQIDLRGGVTLRIQQLWQKFGFYKSLESAEQRYQQEKLAARARREEARKKRKEDRQREREARKAEEAARKEEEAARKAAEEAGEVFEEAAPEEAEGDPVADPAQAPPSEGDPEEDPAQAEGLAQAEADEEVAAQEGAEADDGGGFRLPLPNPVSLLRRTVLAVTGIRDFSITYNGTRSSNSTNVGLPILDSDGTVLGVSDSYSIFDAFRGNGPSLAYRFGRERAIPLRERIIDPSLQVSDVLQNSNRFQGRTALNPSQSLQINLTWNVDWSEGQDLTFRPVLDDAGQFFGVDTTTTSNGNNKSSVWAFKASYLDVFKQQLNTYIADLENAPDPAAQVLGDANRDGKVVLTNESVASDFRSTFASSLGSLGRRSLVPFPMPNWTINYAGLSKWPILRRLVQSMTLRHGYSAEYSTDYRTNTTAASGDTLATFELGTRQIAYSVRDIQVGNIRVNERFTPLVGLDIGWKGRFQTNLAWSKSNAYSLSTSNFEVSENTTDELTFSASYQKTGMKLPFFKRLDNRVTLNLTVSRSKTQDQRFSIRRALIDAAADPFSYDPAAALTGDNVSLVTAFTRLTVSPRIAYQFSQKVQADFTLQYEQFDSEDSRQPSATTINGTFNIQVRISN